MKTKSRSIIILGIFFGYVILQFLWWEILLVKQTGQIIDLKQKLIEVSVANNSAIEKEVNDLHQRKRTQVMMVVGEGTVFLLLLLFGIYKIRQAHKKELELTGQQENFFLSITHELKTPIAATKLQLQTLQRHKLDEDKQKELISNALQENERLNTLIDNVLIASRLGSSGFLFNKQRENISDLVSDTLTRYYKNELQKNILHTQIEKGLLLPLDRTAFPSIITNLVDNALKYSFEGKDVTVLLKKSGDKLLLSVADQGSGI
ncbi:MAG: two-component sensor histidine kinase, partial [Bacteroidetes bacterium]|nr:two-component sensor histidine kinase [Bacteroidota bacterium]